MAHDGLGVWICLKSKRDKNLMLRGCGCYGKDILPKRPFAKKQNSTKSTTGKILVRQKCSAIYTLILGMRRVIMRNNIIWKWEVLTSKCL